MKRQERTLRLNMHGEDVARLQEVLRQLDFSIPQAEAKGHRFGKGTRQAVLAFQEQHSLEPSGEVDARTMARIQKALEGQEAAPLPYVVRGTVCYADGQPFAGCLVRAFDQDPKTPDNPLGSEAITDAQGRYTIDFTEEDFRIGGVESGGPDVFIRVYDGEELLGESPVQRDARDQITLDLQVDRPGPCGPRDWVVRGRVTQRDGAAIVGAAVRALHKQVSAAGTRTLGTTRTTSDGAYQIQYRLDRAARVDLIVEVLERRGDAVLTRSPLVVGAAQDQIIDLIVDNAAYPPASEFDQIEARLAPLLDGSRLDQIDSDSISYLAGKAGISPVRIAEYIQAQCFAQNSRVPAQVYYGMFRANLPVNKPALVAQDDSLLREAVVAASTANVIDPQLAQEPKAVDRAVTRLKGEMVDTIVKQPALPDGSASLGAFLDVAGLNTAQKRTVVRHVQSHTGRGPEFWESLAAQGGINERAIRSLQLAAQLGALTLNNAPLMGTLHRRLRDMGEEPLRGLVDLTADDWLELVRQHRDGDDKIIVPQALQAEDEPDVAYARAMARMVEDAYPTAALLARLKGGDFEGATALAGFVSEHPDFEFRDRSVPSYLRANEIELPADERQALERVSRIFDLAPSFERYATVQPLLAQGIDSAYQIRTMGEQRFLRAFGETLGQDMARRVYSNAAQKSATATSLFARHASSFNNLGLAVIPRPDIEQLLEELHNSSVETIDFPTWEGLFGNIDSCDCTHCSSIYSPAAYLVAVLKYLHDRGALDPLLARRPDIENVELTCQNTHTTLPYIDLVLEVLETFLVIGDETYQTEGEAPALRVHPEHSNAAAYDKLKRDLVYPWTLPFDLWLEEARAYLKPLDVRRHEIMDRFSQSNAADRDLASWLPIAAESLGVTELLDEGNAERNVLLDTTFCPARWNGLDLGALRAVQTLLDVARITFHELRQLLGTRFLNADGALKIEFTVVEGEGAEFVCDLEKARIEALSDDHLNRMGRFVRLRRALGWSIHELDTVLHALGDELTRETLVALSFVKTLHQRLDVPLLTIASWVADMDTRDYLTDDDKTARSYYALLFLNRTVGGDEDLEPFELDKLGSAIIDDNEAAVLAALQLITAEELALIRERRLVDDTLDLANLSELHRVATLKRALGLSVGELLDLLDMSGLNPFDAAQLHDAVQLVDLIETLGAVEIGVPELVYLLRHVYDPNSRFVPTEAQIGIFLTELRSGLQRIETDFAVAPDPTGEITAQMLGIVLESEHLAPTMSLIYGIAGEDELPADPEAFLDDRLASFVTDPATRGTIVDRLLDDGHVDYLQPESQQAARFALVLEPLAAHLCELNSVTLVQQIFADWLGIALDASGLLLGSLARSVADPTQPACALFFEETFLDPANEEITTSAFPDQFAMVHRLHKIALLIERLDLPTEELAWVFEEHATVGWLDLNDLPVAETAGVGARWAQWHQMARAALLRQAWRAGESSLFDLLRQAERGGDAAEYDRFLGAVTDCTGWNRTDLDALLDAARFDLDDLNADWSGAATLSHLWRLQDCFVMLRRLGVSAAMAWRWARPDVTPEVAEEVAAEVKQAARAKYTESQWLNVAEPIRDELRRKQRTVLVDAVIQQIDSPQVKDSNDLYAYFLMDAEMNPCMQTSRIVFVTGAVQLFVQRILLNLEDDVSFSTEDAEMWRWMKNYRVWEANVKVFVTPENWIEPELRPEKSPFFVELENELLQNDVTLETAELAYQTYLERLDEVARLEVVGLYNEEDTKTLHIVARTKSTPHKYFYRQWYRARRWTPWQEVPVDIEAGAVTPVIYNRRLYLFWFTTLEKAEEETQEGQKPLRYLEIRLAWSQYRQRKWSPKRISDVVVRTVGTRCEKDAMLQPAAWRPRPVVRSDGDLLVAVEQTEFYWSWLDSDDLFPPKDFLFLHDGDIKLVRYPDGRTMVRSPVQHASIWSYYARRGTGSALKLRGYDDSWQSVLERAPYTYQVTMPLQYLHYRSSAPFFYGERLRTYFVMPRHIFGLQTFYAGESMVTFPPVDVYLREDMQLHVPEILGPFLPAEASGGVLTPSLESVLHPETRTPPIGTVVSNTIAGVESRVLAQPTLSVVEGGARVIGGDVGVPIVEAGVAVAGATTLPAAGDLAGTAILRAKATTYALEESTVANAVMNVGVAESVWGAMLSGYQRSEYTFYSFYHPYVDLLIRQLNRYGVQGILNPRERGEAHDLRRQLQHEATDCEFEDRYELGEAINDDLLPVEDFDFEYGRAYSIYNWELFFHIPFMIANRLSQNQRFDEARQWYHYIFDPTDNSDLPLDEQPYRFWKVKPFFENTEIQTIEQLMRLLSSDDPADLEMKRRLEDQIRDWRANPFQPHLIAEQRPVAYQKAVVMKYMDNEIAHGDYLFRQDTMESVFEAIQHYLLVAELLGKRPERLPAPEGKPVRTFKELAPHLDAFGNALVQLETQLAGRSISASEAPVPTGGSPGHGDNLEGLAPEPSLPEIAGSTLFFCIPQNEKLLGYWDTVADRLFKIRNCMNIQGLARQLDLFAPPIDPGLLVRAAAAGVDLGGVLNDLNAPRPHYRFSIMVQKALELCNDLKSLGSALLAALEKRDAEELTLLRQTHEQNLLKAVKDVRERQVAEANETLEGLKKTLQSARERHKFYARRKSRIPNEELHLTHMEAADMFDAIAQELSIVGSMLAQIPEFDLGAEGACSSPTVKARFGGSNLSRALNIYSQLFSFQASRNRQAGQRAQTLAGYDRRQEEWDHAAAQADLDSQGLERQVAASEIRIEIAKHQLANQELQIEQSRETEEFMRQKFTNRDLYSWMVTQISTVYFQCYQLAYDVAKRAEVTFQHELADQDTTFISFGYWDSLKKGLLAGDRLTYDLRHMESAYYERNKRELELTKTVSLLRIDPAALVQLRETGSCEFTIPEALFNLDFPGHYLRRLKSVSLTIPSVVGPYSGVNATLTLLGNRIRVSTIEPDHPYGGVNDPRFVTNVGGIQAIATSSGQNDGGLFELNLRDERYLPFEGAGAIGRWRIELNAEYRAFDYDTISDVILHLRYTARDGGAAVRDLVLPELAKRVDDIVNATEDSGLYHFVSLAREFGNELHRFLHPAGADDHSTTLTIRRDHFPYLFQGRPLHVRRVILLLKLRDSELYDDGRPLVVELARTDGPVQSEDLVAEGGLVNGLPEAHYTDVTGEMTTEEAWRLHVTPAAVQALPGKLHQTVEVEGMSIPRMCAEYFEDIGLLIHYTIE